MRRFAKKAGILMSKYSEEWDYKCPSCSSDDTDIIEQQDLIDNFNNKVIAKAYNSQGLEIGRSIIRLKLAKDEAKYVTFEFHKEMDSQLVKSYYVDLL